jgi:enamine deaminase RidA (YjgF/YER057c/UK114 family)
MPPRLPASPFLRLVGTLVCAAPLVLATPATGQEYDPEARLAEMGITLPVPDGPSRSLFSRTVRTGDLVFTSGHAPCGEWDGSGRGKVPTDVTVEQAQAAARQVVICILGSMKAEVGDLSRVTRVVRVFGMVNSAPDFTGQSQVMNAASQLLLDVFGQERGGHVRSAVGMASLPVGLTVEIEMVFEVEGG